MHMKLRFAQSQSPVITASSSTKSRENRMDTGDQALSERKLHNFRVTLLCMPCTRLMNKKLHPHKFH
jgi:hypothetical protein